MGTSSDPQPEFPRVQRLPRNTQGRDLVIGDIHGHFDRVGVELERVGFDTARDRLVAVGDLVDRGPDSKAAGHWLEQPWFHSVRGNHDLSVLASCGYPDPDVEPPHDVSLICGGHEYLDTLDSGRLTTLLQQLASMPYAIEIDTAEGPIGIVHAEIPLPWLDWPSFLAAIEDPDRGRALRQQCVWNRELASLAEPDRVAPPEAGVANVRHVIHGHTPRGRPPIGLQPVHLGNRHWIDTGGWFEAGTGRDWHFPPRFTVVDAGNPWQPL